MDTINDEEFLKIMSQSNVKPEVNTTSSQGSWFDKIKKDPTSRQGLRQAFEKRGDRMNEISDMDFTEGGQYEVTPAYEAVAKGARQISNVAGGVYDVAKATPVIGDVVTGLEKATGYVAKKGIETAMETKVGKALKFTAEKILEQIPDEQKEMAQQKVQEILSMPNVQEAMEALGDLTAGIGTIVGISGAPKVIQQGVKGTTKAITGTIDNIVEKRATKTAADVDKLVGSVVQGKPADISKAKKALQSIDIDGVETYEDLRDRFDEKISNISTKLDDALATKTDAKPLQDLSIKLKVGNSEVSHNYVDDALNQLDELYTKTNDPTGVEEIRQLRAKAEADGLTVKEINDIARKHGNEFSTKAFSKTGDPLTSVNAQAFENTRTGIKNTARELFGDDAYKAADAEMSNLIRSRDLAERMTVEVNKLRQRIQERGMLEKIGRGAFEAFDLLTGKFASGFLRSALVPRGGGLKTLNALDLEKNLAKTLQKIKSIPLDGSADDITRALEDIIKGQSSPSIQDLTPGKTLNKNSTTITPQSITNSSNIPTTVPETVKPVKKSGDIVPEKKVIDELVLEAKKYKSAEEFVKANYRIKDTMVGDSGKMKYKLSDIYNNDELYKKYPILKGTNIRFTNPKNEILNGANGVAVGNDIIISDKLIKKTSDVLEVEKLNKKFNAFVEKESKGTLTDAEYKEATRIQDEISELVNKPGAKVELTDEALRVLAHELQHLKQSVGGKGVKKMTDDLLATFAKDRPELDMSDYYGNPAELEARLSEGKIKTKSQLTEIWNKANNKK